MITKAMVMAAGVGSRLEPLTQNIPKPLVPVLNKPVMDILLQKLKSYGIEKVIANTHYLAQQIEDRYTENSPVDIEFSFIRETDLSGTAGGVKKCESFFEGEEDFLVVSADGLHDADLEKVMRSHKESGCIATMAISAVEHNEVSKYGVVVSSPEHRVIEFQEKPPVNEAKSNFINTGIYVFNKRIFDFIPKGEKYDFAKNVFPALLKAGEKINTYRIYSYWSDIGSIEQYIESNIDALHRKVMIPQPNIIKKYDAVYVCRKNTVLGESVKISNNAVIGSNCKIGKNVSLDNVILWDNTIVADNVTLKNVVAAENTVIKSSITGNEKWEIIAPDKIIDLSLV